MDGAAQINVVREFEGSDLGDVRRQGRLKWMARAFASNPSASFPTATKTHAGLEATYRFLRNKAVAMDGILAGHYEQTAERAASEGDVLAVHDTTIFQFDGEGKRKGLGPIHGHGQGFFGHVTLLVAPGEARRPLGVIAVTKWTRPEGGQKKATKKGQKKTEKATTTKSGQSFEAERWKKNAALAEERVAQRCSLVHVMDREGDSYDLWAALMLAKSRFVIRNSRERVLDEGHYPKETIAGAKTVVERDVQLSRRKKSPIANGRKQPPQRAGRPARLALSAETVTIRRPINCLKELPATLTLNVVHVLEVGTNGDEPPVDWTLVTTEPIATVEDIERVVDMYRSRWVIEDYFKVLKTGCAYEQRQLESEHTLSNALGIFIPIAWQLLLLRSLSRETADAPASEALTSTQIEVLVAWSNGKLPRMPTVRQALLAVAGLGGHIKNNGEPGWLVLLRGFQYLLVLTEGWKIAKTKRSDQ